MHNMHTFSFSPTHSAVILLLRNVSVKKNFESGSIFDAVMTKIGSLFLDLLASVTICVKQQILNNK